MTEIKISRRVLEILNEMEWEDGVARITERIDYVQEYKPTDKVLKSLGGKWVKKIKGHEFDGDGETLVRSVIEAGEYIDPKKAFQFFETPQDIAQRMCDIVEPLEGASILEPSAGNGAIASVATSRGANVTWFELDPSREEKLLELTNGTIGDFMKQSPTIYYDAVLMNPPFTKQQDIAHIQHAWKFIRPGGQLVAICSTGFTFRTNKASIDFREWLEEMNAEIQLLPAGTFKEAGTMVSTCMIHITN
jgi:predicted RNA methylase